jgi:aryl-alcohol dehydrogenase-like predicted oxidoreductase
MERRRLGTSDLHITVLGFGAWAIGGGHWEFGWGPQDDTDSLAAIERAIDLGINWIDTAAVYGLGHSEDVVRRALERIPSSRRPYVFTKGGLVWNERREVVHNLSPNSLRREVDASLARLGRETIDLYQIHWPSFPGGRPVPPGTIEDAWAALADLQRQGKIRHLGASNFDVSHLERIRPIAPVVSLQPPYSVLMRGIEAEILPYCRTHDIGVIIYSPMQSGLLSGTMTRERIAAMPEDDWRRTSEEFQEPRLTRNLELVEGLRAIGRRHARSSGEVAIAWTLRHPAVTGAIVGARRAAQVEGWMGAATFRLSADEAGEVESLLPRRRESS